MTMIRARQRSGLLLCFLVIITALSALQMCAPEVEAGTTFEWSGTNILTTNYTVAADDTLIIYPGARISLNPNVSIFINGTIRAIGTQSEPIFFTSEVPGIYWGSIVLRNSSTNSNMLDYVVIDHATTGIRTRSSSLMVNHTTISASAVYGIHISDCSPSIWNSEISGSGTLDIYIDSVGEGASPMFLGTILDENNIRIEGPKSSMIVQWYLDVEVVDAHNDPVPGAEIIVKDKNGNFESSAYTDSNGQVNRDLFCTEYINYSDSREYLTPHNITVIKKDYRIGYAYPEPFIDEHTQIYIVLVDGVPPVTWMLVGSPNEGNKPLIVASSTSFSFAADDIGADVAFTEYRIDDGDWTIYTEYFYITSPGHHNITYRSTDTIGNVETEKVLWIRVSEPPSGNILLDNIGLISITTVTIVLLGLCSATEYGKYGALKLIFVPLYTRLKKEKLLDQFTRGKIYGYILANPGEHYNSIKKSLRLKNGPLTYHLSVLTRERMIKSQMEGMYKRFYPTNGVTYNNGSDNNMNAPQRHVYETIKKNPGISQKNIADALGESSQVINYHVRLLKDKGLITIQYKGRYSRCYARYK